MANAGVKLGVILRCAVILFFVTHALSAGPVTWQMSNVTFDDSGIAMGFFVFNADTNSITNWDLSTTAGTALGPFQYTPANSSANIFSGIFQFYSDQTFPAWGGYQEQRFLTFNFSDPLTNAGGIIGIIPGAFGTYGSDECLNCNPYRLITGGSVVAVASSVPEPASICLSLLGLSALIASGLRHRN